MLAQRWIADTRSLVMHPFVSLLNEVKTGLLRTKTVKNVWKVSQTEVATFLGVPENQGAMPVCLNYDDL